MQLVNDVADAALTYDPAAHPQLFVEELQNKLMAIMLLVSWVSSWHTAVPHLQVPEFSCIPPVN